MPSSAKFSQLRLKFTDPIQHDYEVIRPIVLFSESIAERSRQTEIERTVVGEKAKRFVQQGMLGLVDQRGGKAGRKGIEYPKPVAQYIIYLKQLYPPIHYREIVRIIERKFGYKTNHHSVKVFLKRYPILVQLEFKWVTFYDFEDAYQARWKVVQMYAQGWNKKSIAGLLKLSHQHVGRIIDAFEQDGFVGLEDKRSRPLNHPHNQLTLPFFKEVLDIQKEHPRAGEFRVHGILENRANKEVPSQRTVGRAMAINRQFHNAPPSWQSDKKEVAQDTTPKYLPYRPLYRHHIWYVDIRYLVKLDDDWIYSICILEGYSRTILAGLASQHQDMASIFQIFFAAFSQYGCPEIIVSDNGTVFTSPQTQNVLEKLHIKPKYIEKGKPWQNLIEAQFKIQLRLADYKFETALTFEQVQHYHAQFIETFNTTSHWAHKKRQDGRRTPIAVLDWVRGRTVDPAQLQRLFQAIRFARTVNRWGFVSILHYYIYAEQGLSRKRVSVWIYEGELRVEYQQTLLAKYLCQYNKHKKQLQDVTYPSLFQTSFKSPQLVLFELDDEQWLKILHRSHSHRKKRITSFAKQLPLPLPDFAA